jgi:ABC-2 type transport system permease protein
MKKNSTLITIAKKEYSDALKNILFLTLAAFLLGLVAISLFVAALNFQAQVAQYNQALDQIKQSGLTGAVLDAPQYYPLQMLRGTIEYLEIIGAIIGMILGYLAIAKEKGSHTTRLLLSRPLGKFSFVGGKILGNSLLLLSVLGLVYLFIFLSISGIGHVMFSRLEIIKLFLSLCFSFFYLMFFFCFAMLLALFFKALPHALIVAFTVWLVFVLIVPQIGDTMDPDNQVPGGFFNSMRMDQNQQKTVMTKFQNYENFRNVLEESSVEKHYERLVFATLGIKDMYNGKELPFIFKDKWGDFLWVWGFCILSIVFSFALFKNRRLLVSPP